MNRRAATLAVCLAFLPLSSWGAEYYLYVDGVEGDSTIEGYERWFLAGSVFWSLERPAGSVAHTIQVVVNDVTGAAALAQSSAAGKTIMRVIVDKVHRPGGERPQATARLTCEEATIRSYASSGISNQGASIEIKVQCGRLQWEFAGISQPGGAPTKSTKGSWNFRTNTP